ncbi:MAG: hypothetical protein AAFY15_00090 [Cyanobacteria bacterium J06648_11]
MAATGEADGGQASVPSDSLGSIDNPGVQQAVTDILEGGEQAFETRRRKYGYPRS